MRAHPDAGPPSASALLREAVALRHEFGGRPIAPAADAADVARHSEELAHELTQLAPLVRGLDLQVLDWHDLATGLHVLVTDQRRAVMPRARALASTLDAAGAAPAMTAVSARIQAGHEPAPAEIGDRLRWMALNTLLDHVTTTDRAISGSGVPGALDTAATTFRATDAAAIQVNADRVRRAAGEAALGRLSEHREEQRFLQAELKKRRKLRSLRELVEQSPEAVLAAAPCWAMSPLLVSRYLPTAALFDVVVYDEASQVTLPDAVPSILRGRQVIVAGDDRQLPPTTVFTKLLDGGGATDGAPLPSAKQDDDDPIPDDEHVEESVELGEGSISTADPAVVAPALGNDYASVLTALSAILPTRTLLWHYRSRDERLIAVSNSHVYGNRLVTFPGPQSDEALQHVVVPPSKGVGKHNKSPGVKSLPSWSCASTMPSGSAASRRSAGRASASSPPASSTRDASRRPSSTGSSMRPTVTSAGSSTSTALSPCS